MTTQELINEAISYFDDTPSDDSENTNRRYRALFYSQQTVEEVWDHFPWSFKKATTTATITGGNNYFNLPATFANFGSWGGVWYSDKQLVEVDLATIVELRASNYGTLDAFCVAMSTDSDSANTKQAQTVSVSGDTTLNVYYDKLPPTLVDAPTDHELYNIPGQYHRTVILPGVVAKLERSKGSQDGFWEGRYREALARMIHNERPYRTSVRKLPPAHRGMY